MFISFGYSVSKFEEHPSNMKIVSLTNEGVIHN